MQDFLKTPEGTEIPDLQRRKCLINEEEDEFWVKAFEMTRLYSDLGAFREIIRFVLDHCIFWLKLVLSGLPIKFSLKVHIHGDIFFWLLSSYR